MLVTGFDIIFFWVARMMMMGLHFTGEVPFRTSTSTAWCATSKGRRCRSPRATSSTRSTSSTSTGPTRCASRWPRWPAQGRDIKLAESRVEGYRNFVTKLWNAARFCEMNAIAPDPDFAHGPGFTPDRATLPLVRWLLAETSAAVAAATAALDQFRFDEYAAGVSRFAWNVFCDWFLELAKPALAEADSAQAVEVEQAAAYVLGIMLRLLHPVTPFVTEELWAQFGYGPSGSLIRAPWPEPFAVAGRRRGARGTGLGGAPGRRGADGARGDERAAVAEGAGSVEGRDAGVAGARRRAGSRRSAGWHGRPRCARWTARCRAAWPRR